MNILAIDIGGTMIKYGLVSSDGKILSTNKIKTEASKGLNNILNKIDNTIFHYNHDTVEYTRSGFTNLGIYFSQFIQLALLYREL